MTYGVILAGGIGSRMGGDKPKQYLTVKGKPIIIYTIEKFLVVPEFEKVIVLAQSSGLSTQRTSLKSTLRLQWTELLLLRVAQQETKLL